MKDNKPTLRDFIIIISLLILVWCALCAELGCNGNSATVKPNNRLENDVAASMENQQAMRDEIDTLNGDLTKYQQSFTSFKTTIMTKIDQKFETLQGSTKTGDVKGDVKTSHDTNSIWYGIGLVAVVLLFVLVAIWLLARIFKEAAVKIFKL